MTSFPTCREVQQWGAGALRHLAVEIGSNRHSEGTKWGWHKWGWHIYNMSRCGYNTCCKPSVH